MQKSLYFLKVLYPVILYGITFMQVQIYRLLSLVLSFFKNSVEIPGPEIDALCNAAKEVGSSAIVGICERISGTTGTMFNTQVYIGPDCKYLGKHQKIMPTFGERFVHKGGYGDTLGYLILNTVRLVH